MAQKTSLKREQFCMLIAQGVSKKAAAIEAGYTATNAAIQADSLMRNPEVLERIEYLKSVGETRDLTEPTILALTGSTETITDEAIVNGMVVRHCGNKVIVEGEEYDLLDPKAVLTLAMAGVVEFHPKQLEAAKTLMPYTHGKVAEIGKKQAAQEEAEKLAGTSMFTALQPPLKVVK